MLSLGQSQFIPSLPGSTVLLFFKKRGKKGATRAKSGSYEEQGRGKMETSIVCCNSLPSCFPWTISLNFTMTVDPVIFSLDAADKGNLCTCNKEPCKEICFPGLTHLEWAVSSSLCLLFPKPVTPPHAQLHLFDTASILYSASNPDLSFCVEDVRALSLASHCANMYH